MDLTALNAEHDRPGLTAARPQAIRPGGHGAVRTSNIYYDTNGRQRTSAVAVPVDQYGTIAGVQFQCNKCKAVKWVSAAVAAKGIPACDVDGLRMTLIPLRGATTIPWAAIRPQVEPQLRAVWALLAVAAIGAAMHSAHIHPAVAAVLAVPVAVLVASRTRVKMVNKAKARGYLTDPATEQRRRQTIYSRARAVGYSIAAAMLWLAVAAYTGVDPDTDGGRVAWTSLVLLWILPAATWWRRLRRLRSARPAAAPEPDGDIPVDPDEAQTRKVWETIVAVRKGAVIGSEMNGNEATPVRALRAGKLVDTFLEDWHTVKGGWGATIVGPDGVYTSDMFMAARGAIASAFRMRTPMVTVIPDSEDENRALVLAQRTSPITDTARWAGPDSIDVEQGTAPIALYADGTVALYEIYRPGWGSPHVGVFGTTGAGKSECLNTLFVIDRWASYIDSTATRQGMVASFLIDPQQGQSFAPFLDDLAGPVAATLDEAKILVQALTNEMLRRNRYLAREAQTWDERRRKWRKGRKWWDPRTDGPILTLTIDEAHAFLADRDFCTMLTAAGRMWRKCGGQVRIATHTPLLADLGGSMALRDMLTGGFVAVFRTANSLSGPVAFNGRLPVDPRTIPAEPGSCYILSGLQPKPMLARAMWEPDYYDWIYNDDDEPIGYPAKLPPVTLAAFGPEYAAWVKHSANPDAGLFVANQPKPPAPAEPPAVCVAAVRVVLAASKEPLDMDGISEKLRENGKAYGVRTIRGALKDLRDAGEVHSDDTRHVHELTPQARERLAVVGANGVSDVG